MFFSFFCYYITICKNYDWLSKNTGRSISHGDKNTVTYQLSALYKDNQVNTVYAQIVVI